MRFAALRSSLVAAALALAVPASAQIVGTGPCKYQINYPVTITDPTIGGIRFAFDARHYFDGRTTGLTLTYELHTRLDENGNGLLEDFFDEDFCVRPPLQGLVIGIAGDPSSGDLDWNSANPSATHHVVMLVNQGVTPLLTDGRDFADLFLVDENVVLNNIYYGMTVPCSIVTDAGPGCAGIHFIQNFVTRLRIGPNAIGPLPPSDPCSVIPERPPELPPELPWPPPGVPQLPPCPTYDTRNAWFDIPGPGEAPIGYDVIKFSSGTRIGSGAVSLVVSPQAVVPEPGTSALLVTGLAGIGAIARRRRRAV